MAIEVRSVVVGEQLFSLSGGLGQVCYCKEVAGLFIMVSYFLRDSLGLGPMERQQRPARPTV